jgi:hypothetical protein
VFNLLGSSQSQFYKYLSLAPRLFDGNRSNAPTKYLCGDAGGVSGVSKWLYCRSGIPSGTVSQYMASTKSSAVTQTPSDKGEGIMTFFDPQAICKVTDDSGKGTLNQAKLFHEALHGDYGVQDSSLETAFNTVDDVGITYYLEDEILGGGESYTESGGILSCPN